jgi:hypothetical protein
MIPGAQLQFGKKQFLTGRILFVHYSMSNWIRDEIGNLFFEEIRG